MASRKSIEDATKQISGLFSKLSSNIRKLIIASFVTRRDIDIPTAMEGVAELIRRTEKKAYPLIEKEIRWHYTSSQLEVTNAMRKAGLTATGKLSEQQIIELNSIISDTLNDYGEALRGTFTATQKVMTDVRKARLEAIFIEGKLQGDTLKELKDKIVNDLAKDFTAIVDKGGREWKLDVYAEMLTRTRMREVTNMGITTRLKMEGYDLVQVSSHGGGCDLCKPWDGRILSMTGATRGYSTVSDAEMGGLFHPNCFKKDTEVYTENGWKTFPELKDEKIMSINPDTQEMEWVNYVNKVAYKYEGEMLRFKSNSFDLSVTPDHMMYVGVNSHEKDGKRKLKWKLVEAREIVGKNHKQLRIPKWKGKDIVSPISSLSISQYAFLLGVYLSEGYVDKNKIIICQSDSRKGRFRKELLGMGFYENKNRFVKTDIEMVEHFRQFGKSYEKYIPKFFLEAKKEILEIFFNGFALGDGSVSKGSYKGFVSQELTVFTSSHKLAGQLGEVIFKIGKYPNFTKPPKPKIINFKNGKYLQKHTCWVIRVNNSRNSYYNVSPSNAYRGIQLKREYCNDMVYDVELEKNHILLVRSNGKTAWSGNCKHRLLPYHIEFQQFDTAVALPDQLRI